MIPGPDFYYKCPKCGNVLSKGSLFSGNTFGAKFYSDGKRIVPMLPSFPVIAKCNVCDTILWLNEANEIKKAETNKIQKADFLTIYEYLLVIDSKNYSSISDEIFIRQRILWGFNDRIRKGDTLFNGGTDKKLWKENNLRLIELLDSDNINQTFLIIELYRNLGEFDMCRIILESIANEKHKWLKDTFNKEIEKKNTLVFRI